MLTELWPPITKAAQAHGLDPFILGGLVQTESGGNNWAIRYEPGFRWVPDDLSDRPRGCSKATERMGRMTSWGLCQLMGQVAREHGFKGWFPELCKPDTGLMIGAGFLSWCIRRRNGEVNKGLLRYNGGGDAGYPGRVLANAAKLKQFIQPGDDDV